MLFFPGGGPASGAAPGFDLADTSGKAVSLSDFRGRPVILSFWATWCPACKEELPVLDRLYRRYKNQGLMVLAVSIDEGGRKAVLPYLASHPLSFPVLLGDEKTSRRYGVAGLPVLFIVGPDGRVVRKYQGPAPQKLVENDILGYLKRRDT